MNGKLGSIVSRAQLARRSREALDISERSRGPSESTIQNGAIQNEVAAVALQSLQFAVLLCSACSSLFVDTRTKENQENYHEHASA